MTVTTSSASLSSFGGRDGERALILQPRRHHSLNVELHHLQELHAHRQDFVFFPRDKTKKEEEEKWFLYFKHKWGRPSKSWEEPLIVIQWFLKDPGILSIDCNSRTLTWIFGGFISFPPLSLLWPVGFTLLFGGWLDQFGARADSVMCMHVWKGVFIQKLVWVCAHPDLCTRSAVFVFTCKGAGTQMRFFIALFLLVSRHAVSVIPIFTRRTAILISSFLRRWRRWLQCVFMKCKWIYLSCRTTRFTNFMLCSFTFRDWIFQRNRPYRVSF